MLYKPPPVPQSSKRMGIPHSSIGSKPRRQIAAVLWLVACAVGCWSGPDGGAAAAGEPSVPANGSVEVSRDQLLDHIRGGWTGMLIGGIEGLAHEFKYIQQPRADLPDFKYLPEGARSDDDNDFEWTHLYFMDKEERLKLPAARLVHKSSGRTDRFWMTN